MFAKHAKSLGRALSVVTALTLSHPSLAQGDSDGDTARLPRPKVSSDAAYQLEQGGGKVGGYAIRVYFEESRTFTNFDAHVFYEPLIYLKTDQHGALLRNVEDDGLLTLYFAVETDTDFLEGEIRRGLIRTAQKRTDKGESQLTPESFKYRIAPLDLAAWFESSKRRLDGERMKSDELAKGPLNEGGRMPIYFETGSRENAVAFVNDLQHGRDQLVFKYRFSGVADEICKAEFRGRATQDIDLYKKVLGPGGQGFVVRHQVADIADSMVSSESVKVRCADPGYAVQLVKDLMDRVGTRTVFNLQGNWEQLDVLVGFDPESFKADLITEADTIEKEAVRTQVLAAVSRAFSVAGSEATETGGAVGIKGVQLGGSHSTAESTAGASAAARKIFADMMKKRGILGSWAGARYVPKSVDVHSAADIRRAWGEDFELEYVFTTGRVAEHSVSLTKDTFSVARDIGSELAKRIEAFLERRLKQMDSSIDSIDYTAEMASQQADRAWERSGTALSRAKKARQKANNLRNSIRSEHYEIDTENCHQRSCAYNTRISANDYPGAFIGGWWNMCDYQHDNVPETLAVVSGRDNDWRIVFREDTECSEVGVVVFFIEAELYKGDSPSWRNVHVDKYPY